MNTLDITILAAALASIAVSLAAVIKIHLRNEAWRLYRAALHEAERMARLNTPEAKIRQRLSDFGLNDRSADEIMSVIGSEREFLKAPAKVHRDPHGYYALLGVSANAQLAAITEAYRKQVRLWHPDKIKDHGNSMLLNLHTEKMKQLNEAYAILSHPARRKLYDDAKP